MLRLVAVLLIAYSASVILATSQGGTVTVRIDGYTANESYEPPAILPLGTTLVLVCRDVGIPYELQNVTEYHWTYPNKQSIQQGYVGPIIKKEVLAINITSNHDSGQYICNVFSNGEHEGSGNFHLKVSGGKVVHSYGRLILNEGVISDRRQLQPPNNASGNGGIECRVSNGKATFSYYGYNVSIDTSKDVYQTEDNGGSNAVVIKQEAQNFAIEGKCAGSYHYLFLKNDTICNKLALANPIVNGSNITVNISELPVGIARAIVGYTRLDLGVPIEGEYANLQSCEIRTFSSLVPGTKYRITAWGLSGGKTNNRTRCQSPTVREVFTSPERATPPRNVTITRIFPKGIQLNWIPPKEPNGDIMCYSIRYTTPDGQEKWVDTPSSIHYYNLMNLMEGQTYTIRVAAYNSIAGFGEESDMTSYHHMHEKVPGPVNVRNSMNSPHFVWDTPNSNSPIVQYELQFRDILGKTMSWSQKNISGASNSAVLEGLKPGVIYGVRMRAVNKHGRGEWGPMLYRKADDVPGKISSWEVISLLSKGIAGLRIEWEEPDSDSEIITYEVKVNLGGNVTETNISRTNYTIKGLTISTEYRVTVTAISLIGRGAESAVQGSIQIPIIVTFNNDLMKVSESEMELHINVTRYGEMKRPLTLIVEDKSMSAKSYEDYVLQSRYLHFIQTTKMEENATIVIKIKNDDAEEDKEEFKLILSAAYNVLYTKQNMTVHIEDDDLDNTPTSPTTTTPTTTGILTR